MQDIIEKDEQEALMRQYVHSKDSRAPLPKQNPNKGYVVTGAPWSSTGEDFPMLSSGGIAPRKAQWGPSALGPKLPRSN